MTILRWVGIWGVLAAMLVGTSACAGPPREVAIAMQEFVFTPAQIEAKPGEKLKLVLTNAGKLPHNFVSADMKVSKSVEVGKTESVDVVAPGQSGTYSFSCDVPGHEPAGMRGTLVVK